jgi:hypothetical protein
VDRADVQELLDAVLGSAPTTEEMQTGEGRFRAAGLMYHRQQERLGLGRGMVTPFTETDETMVAAAREYAAMWELLRSRGEMSAVDFAAMAALHDRFEQRSREFGEASDTVSEIAGIVAATAAGIVVVIATGGTATPAVIATAAAAGAASRVVTREMFGADYYDAVSSEGARDALLGAIDGALAVVGTSLAAHGTELLGLGGRALARGAARAGGQAAEEAGATLGRRIAAGAVEAALDGAFSGSISEAIAAMTDARVWRRGVWNGLVRVGQSSIVGGLAGLGTGAVLGAGLPVIGRGARGAFRAVLGETVDQAAARAGVTEALEAARRAAREGDSERARRLFAEIEEYLTPQQANALWRQLAEGSGVQRVFYDEPVLLGGAEHRLKFQDWMGEYRIVLCTNCGPIINDIDSVLESLPSRVISGESQGVGPHRSLYTRLTNLRNRIETLERRFTNQEIFQFELAQELNQIRGDLRYLAERFGDVPGMEFIGRIPRTAHIVPGGRRAKPYLLAARNNTLDVGDWERFFNTEVDPGSRLALAREMGRARAQALGWEFDQHLSNINTTRHSIRDVYRDPSNNHLYSVDVRHGRFEHCNSRGIHLEEVNLNLGRTEGAKSDHNLRLR